MKANSYDVITIGSGVIDHYVKSSHFELTSRHGLHGGQETCFEMGAKVTCDDLVMDTGGGATNAAVTFANLGMKTSAIFRTGSDLFASIVTDALHATHVDTSFAQHDKKLKTGQSIILLAGTGHRSIITYRGAAAELDAREIPWAKLNAEWFYVTSLAGNTGLVRLLLDRAEAIGAKVAWNPGMAELEKGLSSLKPLLRRVDILDVNREEAALLTDESPRHLKRIVQKLGNLPRIALLLSDGNRGAYLHSRGCTWYAPPLPARRVNTTGAGDALGSGFVAGFSRTCDLVMGLKLGMLNSLGVITHMGAKRGILSAWPHDREFSRVKIRPAKLSD